jgi:RNA polymerase sigma factor (sigma-70 family)
MELDKLTSGLTLPLSREQLNDLVTQLLEAYAGRISGLLRRRRVPADDIPDQLQKVFMKAFISLGGRNTLPDCLEAWLVTIAKNVAMDYHKKKKPEKERRRPYLESDARIIAVGQMAEHEEQETERMMEALRAAIALLPTHLQGVAPLILEGWERANIAAEFGVSLKTVSKWKFKILRHLQQHVKANAERLRA